jgi:hypothetical protein
MMRARLSAALCAALLMSSASFAQTPAKRPPPPPPPSAKDVIDSVSVNPDVEEEAKGRYPAMQREESLPLGQIQRAWDKAPPNQGIYNVEFSPDRVTKIRVRQFMPVTIVFPEWETLSSDPEAGDNFVFAAQRAGTNKLIIRAKFVGADATITVIGDSGTVYPFYVRAEGPNSVNIPDVVVYLHAAPPGAGVVITPAGLRASEAVGLKIADIDSGRMVIRIEHGKGGKDRYVMLSAQLLGILRTYWRLARPGHWLFPGREESKPIDVQVLYSACRSACAAAGLAKRVTVHTLRHSFATHQSWTGLLFGHPHQSPGRSSVAASTPASLATAEKSRRPAIARRRLGSSPYPSARSTHRRTRRSPHHCKILAD